MAVDVAADGSDALMRSRIVRYDVLVLDRDLPGIHGDEVAGRFARSGQRPGSELVARIRALGRRSLPSRPPILRHGDIELDLRATAVVAAAVSLGACGSSSAATTAGGTSSTSARYRARLNLAKCLRAHGVEVPDPTPSASGGFGIFRQIPPGERDSPAFRSAVHACSSALPFRRGGGPAA